MIFDINEKDEEKKRTKIHHLSHFICKLCYTRIREIISEGIIHRAQFAYSLHRVGIPTSVTRQHLADGYKFEYKDSISVSSFPLRNRYKFVYFYLRNVIMRQDESLL